jgi:zinc/manganese transport system substrate-binding protein
MRTRSTRLIAAVAAVAAMAACGQSAPTPSGAEPAIVVVASTDVWGSVARAVGGKEADVKAVIADPSGDPHSYEVTAKDAATLRGAALVVYNGGGYDTFVEQALGDGGPRRINAFDVHQGKTEGSASSKPEHDDDENEHVWYELATVSAVAREIASQLALIRPSAKDTFIANADAFDRGLDGLKSRIGGVAAAAGGGTGRSVVATEPVAHYLLDAAKLTDVTPPEFVEAIELETDPPAAAVAEMQELVSQRKVAVLVHNPQTETPVVTDLLARARAAGLPVVDMTETLPTGLDYLTWMGNQIQALSEALARS